MTEERLARALGRPPEEIREEFVSVAELQRHIMPDPNRLTVFGDYQIFGRTIPIDVVGGDFYDFIDLEQRFSLKNRMGLVIADAAGHGLVAAMLIRDFNTALYTAISFQSYYVRDTTPLLFTKINRRMLSSSQPNQFISAFYAELHLGGLLRFCNCGHYAPLLLKGDRFEFLDTGGPVLGAFRDPPLDFQVGEARLEPEDVLTCYTDGVIEAVDPEGVEYGRERLEVVIRKHRRLSSHEIFDAIIRDLEAFCGPQGQLDDRTVVVIRKDPTA